MPTLDYLINDRPALGLRFLQPGHVSRHGATRVTEVVTRPLAEPPPTLDTPFENGTLYLAVLPTPDAPLPSPPDIRAPDIRALDIRALDHLIRLLARHKAAGLVLATPATTSTPSPTAPSPPRTAWNSPS